MKKNNTLIIILAVMLISILGTALCAFCYAQTLREPALFACIAFGTVAAHFLIMFFSGPAVSMIFGKKFNYNSPWFQQKEFEKKLYKILRVKKWKTKVLAYDSDEYSLKKHTAEEIVMNMCHAEVVHEVIVVASYLPLLGGLFISHWGLLLLTSFVFSCFHLIFVIIQRYNRPRFIRFGRGHK
ncbi:MAG: hypothetical protein K2N60_13035 [Oscillospiraceae bacterium]|nr:hypothetical protein [Oscillospiraceae bacterium]